MSTSPFNKTPTLTVIDNRGLAVRNIAYHRHPDTPALTNVRITRHRYDPRGSLVQSIDPRLHDAGLANFAWLADLTGNTLSTQSADAGTTIALNDTAGRPFITVSNIRTADDGTEDRSQAVTRSWQYEDEHLPGRPLSVTEQMTGKDKRIAELFRYASATDAEKALNLAGQCISHYDTSGLTQTDSLSLTGIPLQVTLRLLKNADNPDTVADWWGEDVSAWNTLLDDERFTTRTTADACGTVLTTTDAKGNVQRTTHDVAGLLSGCWLTLKGCTEQVIVKSLTWSASRQKLREEHGNGVVTTYTYEPETQRLAGIKTVRPSGHSAGAKILQDLRYEYDPIGNVLKVRNDAEETRFWRNQKVVPENAYAYDSLYQLVRATGREMANDGQHSSHLPSANIPLPTDSSAYTRYTRTYTYDNSGNLTQIRHSAPATDNSYTTDITISHRSNRGVLSMLTKNSADVDALFTAGGQQNQLQPGQTLLWTSRNELLTASQIQRDGLTNDRESYRYNAASQRVLKVSTQKMNRSTKTLRAVYLPGLELRTTTTGTTIKETLHAVTVGEAGQVRMLHWEQGKPEGIDNNQLRYSYDNLIGSRGLELDGDGNIISQEEYYPYGGTAISTARSQAEASYKTARYSGKERDATGLYYYGYRYYQPWAGRWLSADPAGTVDGLNLFGMVRNNPVTFCDKNGLMIYNFADPRNVDLNNQSTQNGRIVRSQRTHAKIVADFNMPKLSLSKPAIKYLENSRPGNLFSGIVEIRTGEINIHPLSPHRIGEGGPSTYEDWKKEYTGEFHSADGNVKPKSIIHDPSTGKGMTSHQQTARIYRQAEFNSIGFSFYDVRHLRAGGNFNARTASDNTSAFYGRSRSLNEPHFLRVPDDVTSIGDNLADFNEAKKVQFTEALKKTKTTYSTPEIPIEMKRLIIGSFIESAEKLSNSAQRAAMLNLFNNELARDENRVDTYAILKQRSSQSKPVHFYV